MALAQLNTPSLLFSVRNTSTSISDRVSIFIRQNLGFPPLKQPGSMVGNDTGLWGYVTFHLTFSCTSIEGQAFSSGN